jgi:hypothetical protein
MGRRGNLGRLRKETPAFALRNCHLVSRSFAHSLKAGTHALRRFAKQSCISNELVATVLIPIQLTQPYLRMLWTYSTVCRTWKREGYVRSVESLDFLTSQEAHIPDPKSRHCPMCYPSVARLGCGPHTFCFCSGWSCSTCTMVRWQA